jgi:hypothetical protein
MTIHLLTFANTEYMDTDRIYGEAKLFDLFTTINCWNEGNIPEFIGKHQNHFVQFKKRGFGLWMWKPYIILKKISQIKDGEYLLYIDAGSHLNINGKKKFLQYLELLKDDKNHVIAWQTNQNYKGKFYVKADCVYAYFPQFYEHDFTTYYAGALLLKKSAFTQRLIQDWLALCEKTNFLDPSSSQTYPDPPFFIGQDADNGLLNLVMGKFIAQHEEFGKIISIYPDEVSLYHSNGRQLIHEVGYDLFLEADWSSLNASPIQFRRERQHNI